MGSRSLSAELTVNSLIWVSLNIQISKMLFKTFLCIVLVMSLSMPCTQAGPLSYGACQTGCNTVWVACVSAAGGVAGVSTGGAGVPAAILACNTANGVCMATCAALLLAPSP